MKRGATVAIDIEVVGIEWSELDEATRGYLLDRSRDEEERSQVPHRLALVPGCGRVVAIGLYNLDEKRGAVLLEGDEPSWKPWPGRQDGAFLFRGSEKEILEAFWERLRNYGTVVSYCGRTYDGPVLMIRSAMLGVRPSRNLVPPRYQIGEHCDLMEVLTFHGAVRERYSLEYWCRRFGIASPKVMLDGSQVGRYHAEGKLELIGDYCLRDCAATAELYEKLRPTLLRSRT
jgi:hypothetical protein